MPGTARTPDFVDFESRADKSQCDLKKIGGRAYWEHPTAEVICAVLQVEGEIVEWAPGDRCPYGRTRPDAVAAHNMMTFDRHAWRRLGWPEPRRYIDTMHLAARAGYPGSLDKLLTRLLGRRKDKEGNAFTLRLSQPSKAKARLGQLPLITPEVLRRVMAYCRDDLTGTVGLWPFLEDFLDVETDAEEVDRLINDRGICFDVALAKALLREDARHGAEGVGVDPRVLDKRETVEWLRHLGARITNPDTNTMRRLQKQHAPDGKVPNPAIVKFATERLFVSGIRHAATFCKWMRESGATDCHSATADEVEQYEHHPKRAVRELVQARTALASIVRGKLEAGIARVSPDGRLRDMFKYWAAHAQPNSEPVRTPLGWVAMGELRVGDVIQGRTGPTRVAGTYPQGLRQVYRVTFSDGSWTRCDAEHLWSVRACGKPRVIRLRDLGDLSYGKRHRYTVPFVADRTERPDVLPIDPYTLGALLGDGCMVGDCPRFTSGDPEIAARFQLNGVRAVVRPVPGKKAFHYRFVISTANATSCGHGGRAVRGLCVGCYYALVRRGEPLPPRRRNPLRVALEGLGLWGHDSFTKFIPPEYGLASFAARVELLRGLFDTDGSAKSPGVVKYATCSPHLRDAVIELVQSIGGTARAYVERLGDGVIYSVNCHIPVDVCPFGLERKARRWTGTRRAPWRAVVSVEKDGVEESTCIEVEASDHLYITRGYIVTHNTGRWAGVGLQPHNLTRPDDIFEKWTDKDIRRRVRDVIAGAHVHPLEMPMLLRACLYAEPGCVFVERDFKGVEARGLAWTAEDAAALAVVASGADPYKAMASRIFGVPVEEIGKDERRQIGKIAELMLGYGAGARKFQSNADKELAKIGKTLADVGTDGQTVVDTWREVHAPIVQFWADIENAAKDAIGGHTGLCGLRNMFRFESDGKDVALILPSGRFVLYPGMRFASRRDATLANEALTKKGLEGNRRPGGIVFDGHRGVDWTYGGKLTENAVQAMCRCLLAAALVRAERRGLKMVIHIHDSAGAEVPRALRKIAARTLDECMLELPQWAYDFPIDCDGFTGERYRK
jgi:hypothetical protein